jgi:hypothetical protein
MSSFKETRRKRKDISRWRKELPLSADTFTKFPTKRKKTVKLYYNIFHHNKGLPEKYSALMK